MSAGLPLRAASVYVPSCELMPPLPHALEPGLGAPRQGEVSAVAAGGGKQRVEDLRMGGTSAFEVEETVWWENAMPSTVMALLTTAIDQVP